MNIAGKETRPFVWVVVLGLVLVGIARAKKDLPSRSIFPVQAKD